MIRNLLVISIILLNIIGVSFSQIRIEEYATSERKGITYDNHYFETENGIISIKIKTIAPIVITRNSVPNINKNELIIQTYIGQDLKENNSLDYTLPHSNAVFEFVKLCNNRLYIFYTAFDRSRSTEQLFAQEISTSSGQPIGNEKLLISVPERLVPNPRIISSSAASALPAHNEQGKFELVKSKNNKFLLFKYQFKKEKVNGGIFDRYGVVLFDNDLNLLWSQNDFTFPYLSKHLNYADFIVSNNGKGYVLAKRMKDEPVSGSKSKSDPDNFSVSVFIISGDETMKEINFNLEGHLIKSVAFSDLSNGDIMCAGYYYAPDKMKFTKGIFTSLLSQNGNEEFEKPNFYDFTQEFVELYSGISNTKKKSNEKKVESGNFGFEYLKMKNIFRTEDGGLLLIGGLKLPVNNGASVGRSSTMTGGGRMWNPAGVAPRSGFAYSWSSSSVSTGFSDDIILTKLDDKGELMWMQKIPKRTFSGARVLISGKEIYALFLDDPSNIHLKESDAPKPLELSSGTLVAHKIALDSGERKIIVISDTKEINGNKISYIDRWNMIYELFPLTSETGYGCQLKTGKKQDKIFKFIFE